MSKLPTPTRCDTFWKVLVKVTTAKYNIDYTLHSLLTLSIHAAGAHVRGAECVDDFRA